MNLIKEVDILDGLSKCIVYCLNQIGADRTISATFYILKGKKSSQTIQDIHLFHLTPYFCVFPELSRKDYDIYLNKLSKQKLIYFQDDNHVAVTEKGKNELSDIILPKLNGYKYGKNTQIFWKRFLLLTQTISHLNNKSNRFRPIVVDEDIQLFVKNYLLNNLVSKTQINDFLYEDCFKFLQSREKNECDIFVMKLTGSDKIGLTNNQIATKLEIDVWDVHLIFQSMMHDLLSRIEKFKVLSSICPKMELRKLSDSALKTKKLYQLNKTIEEISATRNLKKSTVEDHFIEIMMQDPTIPIEHFVSLENQNLIKDIYKQTTSKKLSEMKQMLNSDISYFEIRLVLARMEEYD